MGPMTPRVGRQVNTDLSAFLSRKLAWHRNTFLGSEGESKKLNGTIEVTPVVLSLQVWTRTCQKNLSNIFLARNSVSANTWFHWWFYCTLRCRVSVWLSISVAGTPPPTPAQHDFWAARTILSNFHFQIFFSNFFFTQNFSSMSCGWSNAWHNATKRSSFSLYKWIDWCEQTSDIWTRQLDTQGHMSHGDREQMLCDQDKCRKMTTTWQRCNGPRLIQTGKDSHGVLLCVRGGRPSKQKFSQ